jgi:hypothetical protein
VGAVSRRAEQIELRARMRAAGMTYEDISVEFARRYGLRPRAALRHAHGWTLQEAAGRINAHTARAGTDSQGNAAMTGSRLYEWEAWPGPSGKRPTPQALTLLADVYGTDIHHLLDLDDREHLTAQDQMLINSIPRRDTRDPHGDERPSPRTGGRARPPLVAYDMFQRVRSADSDLVLDEDEEERLRRAISRPSRVDGRVVASLAAILAEQRATEDLIGSSRLLVPVVAQLGEVERLIGEASGGIREPLVDIAAQWAEFAGWLHIATGRWDDARAWLDRAAVWAWEVDAATLHATIISFQGHLAFHRGQLSPAVSLSRAASRDPRVWVGQRAYDAHQEARAHALAGQRRQAVEALTRGTDLVAAAASAPDSAPPWIYYYTPEFYALERGWVARYLGRDDPAWNDEAITCLTRGLDGLGDARGSEWAAEFLCHLAAAYLQAGSPDLAGDAGTEAAAIAGATGADRLLPRLRRLCTDLQTRWPNSPATTKLAQTLLYGRSAVA